MQNNSYLPGYGNDDVFSFESNTKPVPVMFKVSKFRDAMEKAFQSCQQLADVVSEFLKSQGVHIDTGIKMNGRSSCNNNLMWFGEGIDCEVLKLGAKGWQKGKVRIRVSLEFHLEQPAIKETSANNEIEIVHPESPLDQLRQMMNENS